MEFLILGLSVGFIILAIAGLKLHPFLALILAGFLVGVLSPQPLDLDEKTALEHQRLATLRAAGNLSPEEFETLTQTARQRVREALEEAAKPGSQAVDALEYTAREFGSTAASIGIVIVLAAIIGQCLMESGAADKIVRRTLQLLGEKRAPLSLMTSGYFLSIPVFFDTVFLLLIPLARALRVRTHKHYVLYVMAIAGGAVVTHSLVPPTPGPLIMVDNLGPMGLNLGTALLVGFLLGMVPAFAGLAYARILDRKVNIPFREALGSSTEDLEAIVGREESRLPPLWLSLLPVALPVLMIAGQTLIETLHQEAILTVSPLVLGWSAFLGNKNLALLMGAFLALFLLARQSHAGIRALRDRLEPAFLSAGLIILITSAGGAFGKMLSRIGLADALRESAQFDYLSGIVLVLLAWGLSSMMKMAQGSGTVAMITASGMMASMLGNVEQLPLHPVYLYAAVGFGSLFVSWMNDSAFWVICKMSGFTEKETLKVWTTLMAVLGLTGLLEVLILSQLFPLI